LPKRGLNPPSIISPPLTGGDEGEGENKIYNLPHPPSSRGRDLLEIL